MLCRNLENKLFYSLSKKFFSTGQYLTLICITSLAATYKLREDTSLKALSDQSSPDNVVLTLLKGSNNITVSGLPGIDVINSVRINPSHSDAAKLFKDVGRGNDGNEYLFGKWQ